MSDLLWTLIVVQAGMGFVDIVIHHELLARLPWRETAGTELHLHGSRNLAYSAFYLLVGWFQPRGSWVLLLLALLAAELTITLWDWLEEDRSRPLPPTERLLHALLTLNYGAILITLAPVLGVWITADTGFFPAAEGAWSWAALLFATVATLFGGKDLMAARRIARWRRHADRPGDLVSALQRRATILVTGATGLIGARLVEALLDAGHGVMVVSRRPERAVALGTPICIVRDLEDVPSHVRIDAIVHLAGAPIAGGLWTDARRRLLLDSRLDISRALGRLIARLHQPPKVWINASAIGWYGTDHGDVPVTEDSGGAGTGFAHELCAAIEQGAERAALGALRVVHLRLGIVLSRSGGFLARVLPGIDLCAGTVLGDGRQWQSWIHRDDAVRAIAFCMARSDLCGAVNVTAPQPVTARLLTSAVARRLRRPALLRVPAVLLRQLFDQLAEQILLASQNVAPARLQEAGFSFRYASLDSALARELGA